MHTQRGFGLVEMLVVTATLGLLSVLISSGLERTQTFASNEMSVTTVEMSFSAALDKVRRQLAIARVDAPVDSGTRVRFMVPVDHDGDGLTYDKSGAVTFGFTTGGAPVIGAAAWFAYVVDRVVTEAEIDLDVNRDGDLADAYELGWLEQRLPGGERVRLTGAWLLQEAGNPGGDVDEDGVPDPMFEVISTGGAKLARLRFFGLHRRADGAWRRFDYDTTIRLRNDD